jgi:hypothetical protein
MHSFRPLPLTVLVGTVVCPTVTCGPDEPTSPAVGPSPGRDEATAVPPQPRRHLHRLRLRRMPLTLLSRKAPNGHPDHD